MELGLFLIHVAVGAFVAGHGAQKLFGWFGGHGLEGTGRNMEAMGLAPGRPMAFAAGTSELAGGLMLAVGFLMPVAAAAVAATMFVAARTAHAGKGPWAPNGGWEYVMTIAAVAIGLAFNGAGEWSIDGAIGWSLHGTEWGIFATLAALLGAGGVLALRDRAAGRMTAAPAR
jgi:putative oxidoreductase